MACLTDKMRLATFYQAKILRKKLDSEIKARDATNLMKCFTVHKHKVAYTQSFKPYLSIPYQPRRFEID